MTQRLARFVPIVGWLPGYPRSSLGRDLLAALAVWAVLVPQAVAYAALAGAPPEAGLATALAAGVLYAIFGTCRELDVGPSSTIAITASAVLIPVVASYPGPTYAALLAALAMLTGVVLIVAGVLRLGFVSEFLARPVIVGFISGIGVLIIVGQIPKLLGITVESGNVPETVNLLATLTAGLTATGLPPSIVVNPGQVQTIPRLLQPVRQVSLRSLRLH